MTRTLERGVLGVAMSVVAFVIERRVLKAIKAGGGATTFGSAGAEGELTAPAEKVHDQSRRKGRP